MKEKPRKLAVPRPVWMVLYGTVKEYETEFEPRQVMRGNGEPIPGAWEAWFVGDYNRNRSWQRVHLTREAALKRAIEYLQEEVAHHTYKRDVAAQKLVKRSEELAGVAHEA